MRTLRSTKRTESSFLAGLGMTLQKVSCADFTQQLSAYALCWFSACLHECHNHLFIGAPGSSEDGIETDLLNSDSEHSDEEELNPDDFSEDVGT